MPNPFMKTSVHRQATNTERPHEIAPVPESYAGANNPYRGLEEHGVESNSEPHDPNTNAFDPDHPDGHLVHLEEPPTIPDPVPVIIVNEYREELRRLGTDRFILDFTVANNAAARPAELVGRSLERATVRLRNCDAANIVLIAGTREDAPMKGYPLYPGQELQLATEDPIFAVVVSSTYGVPTTTCIVGVVYEYRVREA